MPNAFTEIAPINQYVSQFVPLPLEEMMKAGAMKQEAYDKAMADVSTAETPIVGGNITKDQAAMLNQKINSDLSKLVDEANKNDNYSKLQYQVKNYMNQLKADPIYQGIELDKLLSPKADEAVLSSEFGNSVQDFYDNENKKYIQKDLKTPFNASDYKLIEPFDFIKDHQDIYNAFMENVTKVGGPVSGLKYEYVPDGNGGTTLVGYNEQHQVMRKGISPEDVQAFAERFTSDPNNYKTRKSIIYRDALQRKLYGIGYDQSDYIADLVNNFPRYHGINEDIITDKQAIGIKGKKAKGNSNEKEVPNRFLNLVSDMTSPNNTDKSVSINTGDYVALHGGNDNKNGTFTTNTTGKKVYFNIGKVMPGKSPAYIDKLNTYIDLKEQQNNLEEDYKNIAYETSTPTLDRYTASIDDGFHSKNGNIYYKTNESVPGDETGGKIYEFNPKTRTEKEISKDYILNLQDNKDLVENYKKTDNKYTAIKVRALKQGIDLNDEELKKDSENLKNNKYVEAFSTLIEELNGDHTFSQGSGKQMSLTYDGQIITKQTLNLTEDELDNLKDSKDGADFWGIRNLGWRKIMAENPNFIKKGSKDKDGKQLYSIDTYMVANNDSGAITEAMQKNQYSTQDGGMPEWVATNINSARQNSSEKIQELQYKNITEQKSNIFAKGKYEINSDLKRLFNENFNKHYNELQGEKFSEARKNISELHDNIMSLPENTEKERKIKAEKMYDLELYLDNTELWYKFHPEEDDNLGKSKEGWTQTPAKPL